MRPHVSNIEKSNTSNSDMDAELPPEDILSSSLQTLYSYTPVSFSEKLFVHKPSGLTLTSPDTAPSNWGLHASSIWIASLFLANHIDDVVLTPLSENDVASVLELGASSGLPGILVAKRTSGKANVTLSDYPDDAILHCLKENVRINHLSCSTVKVVGHSWGQNTAALGVFDIILAADTLWNSDQHFPFCQTLSRVLRWNEKARIYLVAGLHTGRWTIQRFLDKLGRFGFAIERAIERRVDATFDSNDTISCPLERDWRVEQDEQDESERRNWVVWIVVKWAEIPPHIEP